MEDDYVVDQGKNAKFNAGILQTQRINKILDLLNFCKNNPLAFNSDYTDWNFNIILCCINNLYDEIDGYMKHEEKNYCIKIYEKIEDMIEKYPLLETKKNLNSGTSQIPNKDNWKLIKKVFARWERLVKQYGIKYQVLSATIDDDLDGL